MNDSQRDTLTIAFAVLVVLLAGLVTRHFFLPLLWASVVCIATWPAYMALCQITGGRQVIAAFLLTGLLMLVFIIPLGFGFAQISREAPLIADFIAKGNANGIVAPSWLEDTPLVGRYLRQWWGATLGQPHGLSHLLAGRPLGRFGSPNEILRNLGTEGVHRLIDAAFAFLCMFFFYKDGDVLIRQIRRNGARCLGQRNWDRYAKRIPITIRATVNGLVLVGLGEGVLLGVAYWIAGLRAPALWAVATGALAIIPFGAPVAFLAAAAVLGADGNTAGAIGVAAWGMIVLFVADHFIRPTMIGSATRLPFLVVLFGILGGVEAFGLVGLLVGPALMALFMALWRAGEDDVPAGS